MITKEMKSTLLDIEINNPEGIRNLKALLKNYSDIINKDQSTLSEEEEQSLCDLQDNIMILMFGPLYSQFKFEYIQSDTIMDEEETFIEDLCKFYFENFGHLFCNPNSDFNNLLRTQNKQRQKKK